MQLSKGILLQIQLTGLTLKPIKLQVQLRLRLHTSYCGKYGSFYKRHSNLYE